jgi:hypothetical protein
MATRNIVPRADGEGSLGTAAKKWLNAFLTNLTVTGMITGNLTGNVTGTADNADYAQNGVPVGTLIDYAGQTAPAGYLVCDGSLVSRTTYADLFKAIGTLYGTGDGSTTFGLPNLIDKFKQGASSAGTYKEAGLPNIKGSLQGDVFGAGISLNFTNLTGAFSASNGNLYSLTGNGQIGNTNNAFLQLDASKYSSVYSDTVTTVQPPALTVLPCIKY